ncbi:12143_t:CDS:10 [Entrophospora sp. SA101]|nr:12143_t:CDS:10 [Entrophospora sp. SA101]
MVRPTNEVPPKLIATYGKHFKFLGREETAEQLWNGTLNKNGVKKRYYAHWNKIKDCNFHPIPFIAAGPGTGKTRVLEENNAVLIDITYGNGCAASATDSNIGGETSLSLRVLYRYFVEGYPNLEFSGFVDIIKNTFLNVGDFGLENVLNAIALDIKREKIMIINCIDEVNKLYGLDDSTFKTMVNAVGSCSCALSSIFYVPLLAGTIYKPLQNIVTKSTHPPLPISLPLLRMDHMLEIGQGLQFPVETNINAVDFLQVMTDVCVLLNEHYELEEFTHDNSDIIAGCLLDEMMILDERIKELKQYGIVVLEEAHSYPGHVYLRLQYIMLWCMTRVSNKSNKLYQLWKPMIESDELFLWQNWEDFNVRFLALKFCLLSVYGYKEIKACDFLKNAYCGDMIKNITIKIPDWKDVEVHFIKERFPGNGSWTVTDIYSNEKLFIKEKKLTVYKNGESAPFDRFTNMITKEYESTKKTLIDKLSLQDDDFIFILLSICPLSEEIDLETMSKDVKNAALICKNNFCDFYGFTYATRAQFAAAQGKINVNTAKFWELRLINGVGEILANDIVEKCKRDHFVEEDDLCRRTKFPKHAASLNLKRYRFFQRRQHSDQIENACIMSSEISVEELDETFNRIALSITNGNDLFGQDDNLEDVSHLDDNCDEEVINLDGVNDSHLIITESIDLNSSLLSNNNILSNEIYEENDIDHGDTNFDIDEFDGKEEDDNNNSEDPTYTEEIVDLSFVESDEKKDKIKLTPNDLISDGILEINHIGLYNQKLYQIIIKNEYLGSFTYIEWHDSMCLTNQENAFVHNYILYGSITIPDRIDED